MNQVFAWPVGHDRRGLQLDTVVFAGSAVVGGLMLGTTIALFGVVLERIPEVTGPVLFAVASVAVAAQLLGVMPFPHRDKQVPRRWLEAGQVKAASMFGITLGFGVLTRLRYPAAYAILAALVATGEPFWAVAAGAAFGAVRGLVPVVFSALDSEIKAAAVEDFLASPRVANKIWLSLTVVAIVALILVAIQTPF